MLAAAPSVLVELSREAFSSLITLLGTVWLVLQLYPSLHSYTKPCQNEFHVKMGPTAFELDNDIFHLLGSEMLFLRKLLQGLDSANPST